MQSIDHILVPIDFSPLSLRAARFAIRFAEKTNPRIDLLHVWEPPNLLGHNPMEQLPSGLWLAAREIAQTSVNKCMVDFTSKLENEMMAVMDDHHFLRITRLVEYGDSAAPAITRIAKEHGHNMIIIGTHGRRGWQRMIMGSVAERVVRTAPCPVITVPPSADIQQQVEAA